MHPFHARSDDSKGDYDSGHHKHKCSFIPEPMSTISPDIKEYLSSKEWKRVNDWDEILHKAANRSLDLTIEQLDRAEFEMKLREFQRIQRAVVQKCKIIVPCNTAGIPPIPQEETDCIVRDSGCGFDCMDDYFRQQ